MIIFLYGRDSYRGKQKLFEIIESYKKTHKNGLSLSIFGDQKISFQDLKNQIQSISMFKEKKLAIVKNSLADKAFKEEFLKNKEFFLKTEEIIVFFEDKELPSRDATASFLKDNASKIQEFEPLSGAKLKNWIKKEIEKYGVEADIAVIEKLSRDVGGDLWQMSNEIKKLANFKRKGKISIKDVDLLVRPKAEADIFKTIDFIAKKDKKNAFLLIKKHLEKGESPFYIFTMINFQFRNLIMVKEKCKEGNPDSPAKISLFAKELGIHPFVFRKAFYQSGYFQFEELKKIYQSLFRIDLATKTGEISPENALDIFIAQL